MDIFHLISLRYMRKYIVRKNFNEKNTDHLDIPERSVFFQKKRPSFRNITKFDNSKDNEQQIKSNQDPSVLIKKQEIKQKENDIPYTTLAEKLFQESFSAIDEFNDKKMKNMYQLLKKEKKLSEELNNKLHHNLSKIANAEIELVKKKNLIEKELDQKTKQLIDSERLSAIGELASRLSHDLRNPLTVIKGGMDIIKLRKNIANDSFVIKRLEVMGESIFRMTHQIDGVLDYVRKTPLEKNFESMEKIIQNSLVPFSIYTNIDIILPENNVTYKCDSIKMEIVFGNLIFNSIQAIGKEPGQIIIKINETHDSVIITIHDSGKGISKENISKIFEPLFTTKQEGTGLGLSSVKRIVESHGGKISVTSPPTISTITLPKTSD